MTELALEVLWQDPIWRTFMDHGIEKLQWFVNQEREEL